MAVWAEQVGRLLELLIPSQPNPLPDHQHHPVYHDNLEDGTRRFGHQNQLLEQLSCSPGAVAIAHISGQLPRKFRGFRSSPPFSCTPSHFLFNGIVIGQSEPMQN